MSCRLAVPGRHGGGHLLARLAEQSTYGELVEQRRQRQVVDVDAFVAVVISGLQRCRILEQEAVMLALDANLGDGLPPQLRVHPADDRPDRGS